MSQHETILETRVRTAVLERLLRGEPVDPVSLGARTGLAVETVVGAIASLHKSGAIHLSDGTVTAAYPLSGVPTCHRVRRDRTTVFACCAIDALAVPSMVDEAVTIESHCAYCDEAITVRMKRDRALSSHPETSVVFHVARDCCETGPTILTRCPHINFFCGRDHVNRWQAKNPGLTGDTLSLAQAVTRAREIFGAAIRLVRGEDINS